jgi:hypothetical protein
MPERLRRVHRVRPFIEEKIMIRTKSISPFCRMLFLGLLGVPLATTSCGTSAVHQDVGGSLRMPLTAVSASGRLYRLRNATFDITGTQSSSISSETDPGAQDLVATLPKGSYSIQLRDGWSMERQSDAGFLAVDATLTSSSAVMFAINDAQVTNVAFRFAVAGDVVVVGNGTLDVGINVDEPDASSGAGGASLCMAGDCSAVLPMDGFMNIDTAQGAPQGSDVIQAGCMPSDIPGQQVPLRVQHWQLAGPGIMPGVNYQVDLHFYGVLECKTYRGGMGPARTDTATLDVNVQHNLWLAGGSDPGDHWNTHAFTITPMPNNMLAGIGSTDAGVPPVAQSFMINQCPSMQQEGHFTWPINFASSITVPGGSFINFLEFDTNCRSINNCGAVDALSSCNGPFNTVPQVTEAVPNTNANFSQPPGNTLGAHTQWWLVDVTNVRPL